MSGPRREPLDWKDAYPHLRRVVSGTIRSYERDPTRRDELVTSILEEAWLQLSRGDGPEAPKALVPWLAGFARNLGKEHARREAPRRRARPVPLPQQLAAQSGSEEDSLAIETLLPKIPRREWRIAVQLRYLRNRSYLQIARKYSVKPATARSWVHRGLRVLRRLVRADRPPRTHGPPPRST